MSRNSRTDWRFRRASGLWVRTTMPSATAVPHEGCSLGIFSISTRHILQFATTERPG